MADNQNARSTLPTELQGVDIAAKRATMDGFDSITRAINTSGLAANERKGFQTASMLSDNELTFAYRQDALAMDAVQKPPIDITRAWWDIQSESAEDNAKEVEGWIDDHGFRVLFKYAMIWARLYGGAAIVLGVDDGQEPSMPIREASIRDVKWARVVDRRYIHVLMRSRDSESWDFGKPMLYNVGLRYAGSQVVHASRVLAFIGEPLPDDYRDEVDGWGDSVLERSWDAISRYNTAARSITIACEQFIQSKFMVKDLADWITSEGGAEKALKRLRALKMGLYTGGIAMVDSAVEDFTREGLAMTGLTDSLVQLRKDVAGALKRPESQIFGQQQGTTRTGAAADQATYFASIRSQAKEDGEPQLKQLINIIAHAKRGPIKGVGLDYTLRPGILAEPDPEQEAKTLKTESEAAKILIEAGVIYPSEARKAITGEDSRIIANTDITALIEEDEMEDDIDKSDPTGAVAGTNADPEMDSARPASYRMADVGAAMCLDCAFRRDAKGSPWCDSFNGMVADAFTCDSFKL